MDSDFNSNLCRLCRDALDADVSRWAKNYAGFEKREQSHHSSWSELKSCGETACLLCAFLWHRLEREYDHAVLDSSEAASSFENHDSRDLRFYCDTEVSVYQSRIEWLSIRLCGGSKYKGGFRVYTRVNFKATTERPLKASLPAEAQTSTSSSDTLQVISQWLQECQQKHSSCSDCRIEGWVPSRLVNISHETGRVSLDTQPLQGTRYATLSHCWGKLPTAKLLRESLDQFMREIPASSLSKTFLQAIEVTQRLGLRYLWIDSLCIIQDSAEDWRKESALMAQIYKNGHFNIAAMESVDGAGGLFRNRDPSLMQPLQVRILQDGIATYLSARLYDYYPRPLEVIDRAPLHQRGWVLQERLLSPRTIHFGRQFVLWECRQAIGCEDSRHLESSTERIGMVFRYDQRSGQESAGSALTRWISIVGRYTGAELTFPEKDKLVAISGIAREMDAQLRSSLSSPTTYAAGVWSWHIEDQLLWTAQEPLKSRPSLCGAPSWSWASLHGPVKFLATGTSQDYPLMCVQELSVSPGISGDLFLGVRTGTSITVECYLWPLESWGSSREANSEKGNNLQLHWDEHDTAEVKATWSVYLMPVKSYSLFEKQLIGVILTPRKDNRLCRLGLFEATARGGDVELDMWHYEIADQLMEQRWIRGMGCDPSTLKWSENSEYSIWERHSVTLV